jgi:molybdate transport repressor ModE-like protein
VPLPPRTPELADLDLLLTVARVGSLGRAAREHGLSQPAVSARIAAMERRLGVRLLDRSPNGSRLTPHGTVVVDWARAVVDAADDLNAGVEALRTSRSSRLHVAASMTVAEYLVPTWFVRLRQRLPDVAVSLAVGNSVEVARQVLAGEVVVGFIEAPEVPTGLSSRLLGYDQLELVVPPAHPWARRRRPVEPAELAATPLICREEGSGTRQTLDRALRRHGGPAPALLTLSSTTAITSAVTEGAGPAVVSALATAKDVADGRLVAVPVEGLRLRRPLRAVWGQGRPPEGPARDLVAVAAATRRP